MGRHPCIEQSSYSMSDIGGILPDITHMCGSQAVTSKLCYLERGGICVRWKVGSDDRSRRKDQV